MVTRTSAGTVKNMSRICVYTVPAFKDNLSICLSICQLNSTDFKYIYCHKQYHTPQETIS